MADIVAYGKTDVGLKRKNNEDAFIAKPDLGFCLVADGMGGAAAGELASRLFAETAMVVFSPGSRGSGKDTADLVKEIFHVAHEKIQSHVTEHPDHQGMGCTAELMAVSSEAFVIGHVGDSRTYRLRNKTLRQITVDHSLVQDQIHRGLISQDQARTHSMRHVILRAVGIGEDLAVDIIRGTILPNDIFLLCSDGLTDMVDDERIGRELSLNGGFPEKADRLIELAKAAGGKDNITVVLMGKPA